MPQAVPQPPQLAVSVCVLTQRPMQLFSPIGHEHMPAVQVWPIGQAVPHAPQLALSLAVSTQVIDAPVPQTERGAAHAIAQRPVVQV